MAQTVQEHLAHIRQMTADLELEVLLSLLDGLPIESPLETWEKLLKYQEQLRQIIFEEETKLMPILRRRGAMLLLNKYVAATIVMKLQPQVPLRVARSMLNRLWEREEPKAASSCSEEEVDSGEEEIIYTAKKRQRTE